MGSAYPGALDSFTNPTSTDGMNSPSHSDQHADANDAIEAIQAELGTNPSGSYTTVKDRLDDLAGGGGGSGGLVLVNSGTFSASSAVSVDSVFDSTFDDYRVLVTLASSGASTVVGMRLRASGTDDSTSGHYDANRLVVNVNTVPNENGTDRWQCALVDSALKSSMAYELSSPNLAEATRILGQGECYYTGIGHTFYACNGTQSQATQYDGFTLFPSAGTLTGRWAVYGYAK